MKILGKQASGDIVTSALFVPSSEGGTLTNMLSDEESILSLQLGWKTKIVEKSGIALSLLFRPRFEIIVGCSLGQTCPICNNTGLGCSQKNVIYSMKCTVCASDGGNENTSLQTDLVADNVSAEPESKEQDMTVSRRGTDVIDDQNPRCTVSRRGTEVTNSPDPRCTEQFPEAGVTDNASDEEVVNISNFTYVGETSRPC